MSSINPVYDFNVRQEGENHIFTYQPAKRGFAVGCFIVMWCGLIAVLPLLVLPIKDSETTWYVWIGLTIALTIIVRLIGNSKGKVPNTFVISKDHYKIANNNYDRKHIINLQIKNAIDKRFTHDTVFVGTGFAGGMAGASNDMGRLYRKSKQKSAFYISFLYGSKEMILASPLTESQAIAMYNKISRL